MLEPDGEGENDAEMILNEVLMLRWCHGQVLRSRRNHLHENLVYVINWAGPVNLLSWERKKELNTPSALRNISTPNAPAPLSYLTVLSAISAPRTVRGGSWLRKGTDTRYQALSLWASLPSDRNKAAPRRYAQPWTATFLTNGTYFSAHSGCALRILRVS